MDDDRKQQFYDACSNGDISTIISIDNPDSGTINTGFSHACSCGNLNVVKYLRPKIIMDLYGCDLASNNGHFQVVKYLVSFGHRDNYDNCFLNACDSGHLQIVEFLATKNVTNFDGGLYHSYMQERWDVVKFLIQNRQGLFEISDPSFPYMYRFYQNQVYDLLESGVSMKSFSSRSEYKMLINSIQEFKTRTSTVLQQVLIPDLSKMIVDYSLK